MSLEIMRSGKVLVTTAVIIFLLLSAGLAYILSMQPPDLAEAICQPSDLGERYQLFDGQPDVPLRPLEEAIADAYTVTLIDHQLSNTVLECSILHYADESTAQQALQTVCADRHENLNVGEEACTFATNAPANLAFRRDAFLVLMSGDVGDVIAPATAVDGRLQK